MLGNLVFLKDEGVVKEVRVFAIKQRVVDGVVLVTSTNCIHNGVELGWGERTYYSTKKCIEEVQINANVYSSLGGLHKVDATQVDDLLYNGNGLPQKGSFYASSIVCQDAKQKPIGYCVECDMTNVDEPHLTLPSKQLYKGRDTYDLFNKTKVVHDDGSVEIIGGVVEDFQLNARQQELVKSIEDAIRELNQSGAEVYFNTDEAALMVVNKKPQNYAVALAGCSDEEIEGCRDWDCLPKDAQSIISGVSVTWCDDRYRYARKWGNRLN